MKTYTYLWGIFAFIILGCNKSSNDKDANEEVNVETSYSILINTNNSLTTTLLNADASAMSVSSETSNFDAIEASLVQYKDNGNYFFYKNISDCDGEIIQYDFLNEAQESVDVFPDLLDCELEVLSILSTDNAFYVAYNIAVVNMPSKYIVRKINRNTAEFSFVEVELSKKPLQMAFSNNRLFVLLLDEDITNENEVVVISNSSFSIINTQGLGYDVKKIFTDANDNIILSYDELHAVLDKETLAINYIRYGEGAEPNFADSQILYLDSVGKLYYSMQAEDLLTESIPAVYDLKNNLATLYIYENFLTSAQLQVEYKIEATTVLSYDEENNILLVGYKKSGDQNLGGILRIKPAPNLEFIDNINLTGIPYDIIVH